MTEEQVSKIKKMVDLGEQFDDAMQEALDVCIGEDFWSPLVPESMFGGDGIRRALVYWKGFLAGHKINEPA